jgi:hypothetical protein
MALAYRHLERERLRPGTDAGSPISPQPSEVRIDLNWAVFAPIRPH